jgi:uncharacterized delta-60 repeat protein
MKSAPQYIAALVLLLAQAFPLIAAPGDLDTSFSGDGKLKIEIGEGDSHCFDAVQQPDGKIVAVGRANRGTTALFAVARYNTDGSRDTTFDNDGVSFADPDFGLFDTAFGVALQSDGKIVAVGSTANSEHRFAVVRFMNDGVLDTSFDGDGIVITDFPGNLAIANAVKIQADGRIVVGGRTFAGGSDFAVARYNTDGSLDSNFSGDGVETTDLGFGGGDEASDLAIQSDGKIVLVGSTNVSGAVQIGAARYNSDGTLDTGFDGDGVLFVGHGGSGIGAFASGTGVDIQSDGKLVISALAGNISQFAVVRLNPNGSVDGSNRTTILAGSNIPRSIRVQSDGKIVLAGSTTASGGGAENFAAVRFNLDLTLDTTFSGDGKVSTDFNSSSDIADGLIIQPNGSLVLAGTFFDGIRDFALLRYTGNGSLDFSFDGDGKRVDGVGNGASALNAVKLTSASKILTVGAQVVNSSGDLALYSLNADGTPDTSFSGDGVATFDVGNFSHEEATGAVLQNDGKIVVSGKSSHHQLNVDSSFNGSGFVATGIINSVGGGANGVAVDPSTGKVFLVGWRDNSAFDSNVVLYRISSTGSLEAIVPTNVPGSFTERGRAIALQADGKILVATNGVEDSNEDFVVIRFNTDLTLDTGFSGDGMAFVDFGPGNDFANSIAVQADGKIIVGGHASNGTNFDFGVARLLSDGQLDSTFAGDGTVLTDFEKGDIQLNGKIVTGGSAANGTARDFATARYNSDGTLDTTALWGTDGTVTTELGSDDVINALAIQPNGSVVAVGSSGGNIAAARYLNDPLPPSSADVSVGGRVTTADGLGIRNAALTLTGADGTTFTARTGAFGYYRFEEVPSGETYVLTIHSKRYTFNPSTRLITVKDSIDDADFVALE